MVTFELQKKKSFLGGVRLNFWKVMTHYSSVKIALVFGLKNFSRELRKEKRGLRWSAGGQLLEIQSNHQQHLLASERVDLRLNKLILNFRGWDQEGVNKKVSKFPI